MRKMDSLGLKMCLYQAALFEASLENTSCSSRIFIRRFMFSNLAKRMDSEGFLFDSIGIMDAIEDVQAQYGESLYGIEKFTNEELYWIGYIYRYWAYISGKTSKQLYRLVKPEQLRKLYFPYHSLDPLQAIERIIEGFGLDILETADDISRGVSVLRMVRKRRSENNGSTA